MRKTQKDHEAGQEGASLKKTISAKKMAKQGEENKTIPSTKPPILGLKKQYLKSKSICRVTFRLPEMAAPFAKKVSLVGEFNNWNEKANLMKKNNYGHFTTTIELKPGKEFQFRYLIDNSHWENDWKADKYIPTPFGSENSVVVLGKK